MNRAKYREILDENLHQSTPDLRLGLRFTFQQDNDPKHTAKPRQEWLRDESLNVKGSEYFLNALHSPASLLKSG